MNRVREVAPLDDVIVAEAGVTLHDLRAAADGAGRLFPLSLASEGSCTVGGLLSTNAGGTGVLRYGTTRELTLGVEAVLPNGEIVHGLKRLRKGQYGLRPAGPDDRGGGHAGDRHGRGVQAVPAPRLARRGLCRAGERGQGA